MTSSARMQTRITPQKTINNRPGIRLRWMAINDRVDGSRLAIPAYPFAVPPDTLKRISDELYHERPLCSETGFCQELGVKG